MSDGDPAKKENVFLDLDSGFVADHRNFHHEKKAYPLAPKVTAWPLYFFLLASFANQTPLQPPRASR